MTFQTCMAGSAIPIRKLIETILTDRGHLLSEAPNPARCVDWYTKATDEITCNLMVAEYTGPETLDMIDVLIDRKHIEAGNIAVFSVKNPKDAAEIKAYGCHLLSHPFRVESFVEWVLSCEKRFRKAVALPEQRKI